MDHTVVKWIESTVALVAPEPDLVQTTVEEHRVIITPGSPDNAKYIIGKDGNIINALRTLAAAVAQAPRSNVGIFVDAGPAPGRNLPTGPNPPSAR